MKWMPLVFLMMATPAFADDKIDCANPADTATENQCADMDFQKADKELNALWPKVKAWAEQSDADSDSDVKHYYSNTLLNAQRNWLAYRDAECLMAGLVMHGGSGEGPIIGGCRASLTEQRVKDLKEMLPQ